jgi:hypothetical protein
MACFCLGEEDKQQRIKDGKTVKDREKIMLQNYIHIFVIYVCVYIYTSRAKLTPFNI